MMNLCYEYQHSMMLGSEVIRTNELRMQDAKSVSTRQTKHVGGDVVEGDDPEVGEVEQFREISFFGQEPGSTH